MTDGKSSGKTQITVAIITVVGVLGAAGLANLDKISALLAGAPESEPPVTQAETRALEGSYMFETDASRLIKIHHLGNDVYEIEEPIGRWPWSGTAELDGRKLTGFGRFIETKATMDVIGELKPDGTITVEYHFLTRGDGSSAEGRVDRHVWMRRTP